MRSYIAGQEPCKSCHKAIHDLVPDEKKLGRHYNTLVIQQQVIQQGFTRRQVARLARDARRQQVGRHGLP